MQPAMLVISYLLQAGAFFAFGVMFCRWFDERRAERLLRNAEEQRRLREEHHRVEMYRLAIRPSLWQPRGTARHR